SGRDVDDGEAGGHGPGGPGPGVGDGGGRGRDAQLARAARLAGRRHDVDLDLGRCVAHAGVAEVGEAALADRAAVDVDARLEDDRQGVVQGALQLGLEPAGDDRPADVDGRDRPGDPRPGGVPGVELDQVGDHALVLLVEAYTLGGAGFHRPAP